MPPAGPSEPVWPRRPRNARRLIRPCLNSCAAGDAAAAAAEAEALRLARWGVRAHGGLDLPPRTPARAPPRGTPLGAPDFTAAGGRLATR